MADTYSKLLGLSDSPPPLSDSEKSKTVQTPIKKERKARLLTNQQTSKEENKHATQAKQAQTVRNSSTPPVSTPPSTERDFDTSLYTTKEKTKYGTYLTDESIEKIRIHAIQTKKDDHQVVQEAVNQYFKKLEK